MRARLRAEDGFGLIELMVAVVVLTIALLALAAGYDQAFLSLHRASQKTVAAELADRQLELYRTLPYDSIGLDRATLQALQDPDGAGYDSLYVSDEAGLDDQDDATDATIASCGSTPACSPVQTIAGTDGRSYRLETFVRDVLNNVDVSWTIREVTVVVRDASASAEPEILRMTTGFDRGPG